MAASTVVPLREYLNTPYEPDCEWVAGELKERNSGELPHASVQLFFSTFFAARRRELGIRVYQELRVQVSTDRYRVPDVVVLRGGDPADAIVVVPPLLCIEVLSRDDRASELQEKIDDYLRMGVGMVWVVDPRLRTAVMVDASGRQERVEELTVPGSAIRIPRGEVFAELDELGWKG
jgi:Uma2 family endonuclease